MARPLSLVQAEALAVAVALPLALAAALRVPAAMERRRDPAARLPWCLEQQQGAPLAVLAIGRAGCPPVEPGVLA